MDAQRLFFDNLEWTTSKCEALHCSYSPLFVIPNSDGFNGEIPGHAPPKISPLVLILAPPMFHRLTRHPGNHYVRGVRLDKS